MSYTEIYKFKKDGDATILAEIKNSWRGAMAVWDILDKKYLPPFITLWVSNEEERKRHHPRSIYPIEVKKIWELYKNDEVSEIDKIVLGSTFDRVIIFKKDLPTLIEAFRNFEGETSLKEQADVLEQALKNDNDLIAITWNQTSVGENPWESCEDDETIPYNILKMDNHWDLFEQKTKQDE